MLNPKYFIKEELREAFDYFREGIILEIQDAIKNKKEAMESIKSIQKAMNEFVSNAEKKEKLLESLATVDLANLWTDEGRALIKKEHKILHELLVMEENIRKQLYELRTIELSQAIGVFNRHGGLLPEDSSTAIRTLITNKPTNIRDIQNMIRDIQNMGILYLITLFDYFHIHGTKVEDYLGNLLTEEEIQDLINGKIKRLITDFSVLERYDRHETNIVRLLDAKVRDQNRILTNLLTRIPEKFGQKTEANEQELLRQVLEIGGAIVNTSIPSGYSPRRSSGFQELVSAKRKQSTPSYYLSSIFRMVTQETIQKLGQSAYDVLKHHNVNEAVGMFPYIADVYQDRIVETKSLFRTRRETKREMTGTKTVMHNELVNGGVNEPAYGFVYMALDSYNDRFYKDYSNRFGQNLSFEITLPKSIAETLFAQIKRHPAFVRVVVETVIIQQLGIPIKAWREGDEYTNNHPLSPPYKQWSQKEGGCKMYIQELGDEQGFNANFVHNVT